MDRQTRIQYLVGHYENPRHKGGLREPEVSVPGGNPGCGDVVKMHVRADGPGEGFEALRWEGEGCTISMAAASILADRVHAEGMTLDDVLSLDHDEMMDALGRDVVSSRPKCATLALGTLKAVVRELQRQRKLRAAGATNGPATGQPAGDEPDAASEGLVIGEGARAAARGTSGAESGRAGPRDEPGDGQG